MPFERNIEVRNKEKSDKYAHFVQDITNFTTTVTAFESGSRGYISPSNKQRVHYISIYSSYHIFICRKDVIWAHQNLL